MKDFARFKKTLKEIDQDAHDDVARYEGMPHTGKTAALIVGEQNAMIATLAKILLGVIEEIEGDT